jgi:hypothetical protein
MSPLDPVYIFTFWLPATLAKSGVVALTVRRGHFLYSLAHTIWCLVLQDKALQNIILCRFFSALFFKMLQEFQIGQNCLPIKRHCFPTETQKAFDEILH